MSTYKIYFCAEIKENYLPGKYQFSSEAMHICTNGCNSAKHCMALAIPMAEIYKLFRLQWVYQPNSYCEV